jgi:hypothetical protein
MHALSLQFRSLALSAVAASLLLGTAARAEQATSTIAFSNPDKPGTLKILLARGDLQVEAASQTDVTVHSDSKTPRKQAPRKNGLRVLTASSSFALTEKNNVVTLDAISDGWPATETDFRVIVPLSTTVVVQNSFGGTITVKGVDGDVEVNSMHGAVTLEKIGGGALVSAMNGEVTANMRRLTDKPLSFTSMNGEVVVRVPADAKANVRMRTQNGSILTDFDESVLVTKTETARTAFTTRRRGDSVLPPEAQEAIHEAARISVEAAREAAQAIRDAMNAARDGADAARAPMAPRPPRPPAPPALPTITGGKIVTGTLNGGGPEISVTTMNGDVTLRKLEK